MNSDFSAEDNFASATNKAGRMLFYLKKSLAALTPSIFLPLYKIYISQKKLPAEIVNASSVKSFKALLDARWQSLFPEVPI